ncbi:restriction endonuclease [Alkalibacillus aidingensis]|uniref:restriction endonuclease n=1 Tax=Alkalibacillus aidingensis TaxID=2747607 RepID=UPI001660C47C|nr:restriction endonuclease [Alkalibacillus aidingensis]
MFHTALTIVLIIALIHLLIVNRQKTKQSEQLYHFLNKNEDLKRTLAMGLYYRFNFKKDADTGEFNEKTTNLFIQQVNYEFEGFVAEVMKAKFGGNPIVTGRIGDYGVDIRHHREDGLYLGQVKAYKNDVPFDAIAIIHSNMIKEKAKGGFIVTTSDFTDNAKKYAESLNIELINGQQLITYLLEGLENEEKEIIGGQPSEA